MSEVEMDQDWSKACNQQNIPTLSMLIITALHWLAASHHDHKVAGWSLLACLFSHLSTRTALDATWMFGWTFSSWLHLTVLLVADGSSQLLLALRGLPEGVGVEVDARAAGVL